MNLSGRCLCGAIHYQLSGAPRVVALCHCRDCRRSAGAPAVAWAMFPETSLTVTKGQPRTINSSGTAMRSFCADCGTGLFYRNAAVLPGLVDVQSATLDDPEALPPTVQVQTAERLDWMLHLHELPEFARFPS
ncbi:GFA family protein [Accumulibacter sp.]|uniref:GFA family protein n=1 Tax=Accumulibacter sp. TaxID=2053492 RepID=UPI0025F9392B|nr:GFA family protein [Accumulibacter sp.]MCM8613684.1 GFA family protein [Accumulibacter sp.]MCM8637969.1 GFA family protein [Accumulibacter sp.]MCM8641240.1 GFA family protein [Accumulibacter sp.]